MVLLLAAVQFVNVLEFMIVLPLGPDIAKQIEISMSHLGWISGAYTASAAVTGVIGAAVLDRFDRRSALGVSMLALTVGTALGAAAQSLEWLLATRLLAGAFGGPATSLGYAIVADRVPPERRGRAIGTVMGAFSIAAVFGLPIGLELARLGSWRFTFIAVAASCCAITLLVYTLLPPMRAHIDERSTREPPRPIREFLRDRSVILALATTAAAVSGSFAIIPNISAYFQHNLGYPREHLGWLYMAGGVMAFGGMRLGGLWVDRRGAEFVAILATGIMLVDLAVGFIYFPFLLPPLAIFVGFMVSNALRAIATSALASRVPPPAERARFMSAKAAVQHAASALGAILSSLMLAERPDGALIGMERVATASLLLTLTIPFFMLGLARSVRKGEAARAPWTRIDASEGESGWPP